MLVALLIITSGVTFCSSDNIDLLTAPLFSAETCPSFLASKVEQHGEDAVKENFHNIITKLPKEFQQNAKSILFNVKSSNDYETTCQQIIKIHAAINKRNEEL